MDVSEWDIQEVKQLKKKQLVQFSMVMLVIFILSVLYVKAEWPLSVFLTLPFVLLWFLLYTHSIFS
ncbi:hypothetical protein [Sporosarcina sp. P34]|uniref:hypothetical protein n=1 Tax=Sporosarcina sp. P34 TaxID=2048247 RepID=UPI00118075E1|nr:hypothetical protein [Sporosarcina sp. P34]